MNVLFFSSYVSRESGASHALRETVRRISAGGARPVVAIPDCSDSREMFPSSEFDAVYLPLERPRKAWNPLLHARFAWSLPRTLSALGRLIRERGIEIVHSNEITDFAGGIAGRFCGKPCVFHVRTDAIQRPYRWPLMPLLDSIADVVVVPSEATQAWIAAERPSLGEKIRVIYDHAFDIRGYDPPLSGAAFRAELGITPDAILVVLVSKLVAPKGHECFIRAAEIARRSLKRIYFVIVGGEVPGHEREASAIRTLAEQLAPAPGLRMTGARPDLPAVFAASDIAVHCPTYPDPYPTVVLLAMLSGKPVIGSDTGGIPEQIENGRTGLLVPPGDPDFLADTILRLAQNPGQREALGAAARRKIREEFAPQSQARLLLDIYADLRDAASGERRRAAAAEARARRKTSPAEN